MQIQDSGSSTISDDRRRSSSDASRRMALAAGNGKSDAFAELFQVIATAKVSREKAPALDNALAPSSKSAESVTNASKPEAAADSVKEDDKQDDIDDTSSLVAAQAAAQLVAPVSRPVDEQAAPQTEAVVAKPEKEADNGEWISANAVADASSTAAASVNDKTASDPSQPAQTLDQQASGKQEKRTPALDKQGDKQPGDGPATAAMANTSDRPAEVDRPLAQSQSDEVSQVTAKDHNAVEASTDPGKTTDDRRQDRSERLRDRLSDRVNDAVSSDPVQPISETGTLAVDSSTLTTPVVAQEPVTVPTATTTSAAETIAATVAASAAIAVSEVGGTNATVASGSKLDGKVAASSIGSTGTMGTLDDAASASTMEKASKSRQSEIADRARMIHRISKAFQKLGIDGGQVRLKMHPDDLGTVQLDMKIAGSKVNATVTADSDEAARLLTEHLPELRQRLENQGLTVDRLQVEQRSDSGSSSFSNQQNFQQQYSAYEEAARRQSQRSNYLPGAEVAMATRSSSTAVNTVANSLLSSRSHGTGLDINF